MLFEGLFSGAYIRSDVCVTKVIRLAYSWKEIYVLLYCFCFLRAISTYKPHGAIIRRVFLCYEF